MLIHTMNFKGQEKAKVVKFGAHLTAIIRQTHSPLSKNDLQPAAVYT